MSDTYTGICSVCNEETDVINNICANCFEEKALQKVFKNRKPRKRVKHVMED